MVKEILLLILWLAIIPCFIGLYIIKFAKKDNKNIFLAYIVRNISRIFGF